MINIKNFFVIFAYFVFFVLNIIRKSLFLLEFYHA